MATIITDAMMLDLELTLLPPESVMELRRVADLNMSDSS